LVPLLKKKMKVRKTPGNKGGNGTKYPRKGAFLKEPLKEGG